MCICICIGFYLVYVVVVSHFFFFFKQKTAYEMRISDWSSDVCSSDLDERRGHVLAVVLVLHDRGELEPPEHVHDEPGHGDPGRGRVRCADVPVRAGRLQRGGDHAVRQLVRDDHAAGVMTTDDVVKILEAVGDSWPAAVVMVSIVAGAIAFWALPRLKEIAEAREEERRVGKECVSTGKYRGTPD